MAEAVATQQGRSQNALASLFSPNALDGTEADKVLLDLNNYLLSFSDDDLQSTQASRPSNSCDYLADICKSCQSAKSPVVQATRSNHENCLKKILEFQPHLHPLEVASENGMSLAHIAAQHGSLEVLHLLLEVNQSFCSAINSKGGTPMHLCAYNGHERCLEYLLEVSEHSMIKDQDGATPLHFASASGHMECLKILVQCGDCDANIRTNSGETPVYYAAQEGHLECVQWFVEQVGADPNIPSGDGMTSLHAAAQTGQLNVVRWLVRSAHCPINSRNCDGATPIHFAASKGQVAILEWMLHHSLASGEERDDYGATPIHDAAENGQLECLHVFYSHSVNLNLKDDDGLTPRDLAKEKTHLECDTFLANPEKQIHKLKQDRLQEASTDGAAVQLLMWSQEQKGITPMAQEAKTKKSFTLFSKIKGAVK